MMGYQPLTGYQPALRGQWFVLLFSGDMVLTAAGEVLHNSDALLQAAVNDEPIVTGHFEGKPVAVVSLTHQPDGFVTETLRNVLMLGDEALYPLLSHAVQIQHSRDNHRFCVRCGHRLAPFRGEWAMRCFACSYRIYPIISPCIIVRIDRGNERLLVRHRRHQTSAPQMHTLVAGFMEPGETAEEAVCREVLEEVGVIVRDPQYCFSQSWPFPHSLMLGFTAQYVSGEIKLDNKELVGAGWFSVDTLPELPPAFSLAHRLLVT